MDSFRTCDHSECPAFSLHHVEVFGQDFHFCNHHWVELAPVLSRHLERGDVDEGVLAGQGTWPPSAARPVSTTPAR